MIKKNKVITTIITDMHRRPAIQFYKRVRMAEGMDTALYLFDSLAGRDKGNWICVRPMQEFLEQEYQEKNTTKLAKIVVEISHCP